MPKLYKGQNPNVYLEEARRKDFNEYYQRKIASVKKSIDCYAPKQYDHIQNRQKQKFLERERQKQIDADNAILLKRIEYQYTVDRSAETHLVQKGPKSLNRGRREEELRRITEENRRLHKAIIAQKPNIQNSKMEDDYKKHQYYKLLRQRNPEIFLSEEYQQQLKANSADSEQVQHEIEQEILTAKQQRLAEIGQIVIQDEAQLGQEELPPDNDLYIQEMVVSGDDNFDIELDGYTGDQVYITKQDGEPHDDDAVPAE